jgi:four helix bundle protein
MNHAKETVTQPPRRPSQDGPASYRNLAVWEEAMLLAEECYQLTKGFPRSEQFGLTSQIRRSAVSIPSNVAEGQARRTRREYSRFVEIALGSQAELETQLEIAERVGFLRAEDAESATSRAALVGRLLNGLQRYLLAPSAHVKQR